MSGPLHGHPAADIATEVAVVVVNDRAVVGLGPLLADALVAAPRAGLRCQLLTPPGTRLTWPLAQTLTDLGGQWVVRRPDGRCFDGLVGTVLSWDGDHFAPEPGTADPDWTRTSPAQHGSVAVDVVTVHAATDALTLGGSADTVAAALGADLAGWGVVEPVSQPWDRGAFTTWCRGRAPEPSTAILVGGSGGTTVVGTVQVTRVTTGVRERVQLQIGVSGPPDHETLAVTAARLAAQSTAPRTALLGLQPGRGDGTVEAERTGIAVPYGVLLGPAVVDEAGLARIRSAPVPDVTPVGATDRPSVWIPLLAAEGPVDPGGALAALWAHLDLPTYA